MTTFSQTKMSPLLKHLLLAKKLLLFFIKYLTLKFSSLVNPRVLHNKVIKLVPPDDAADCLKLAPHL